MPKTKIIGLCLIFAGLGVLSAVLVTYFLQSRKPAAGLRIEAEPASLVFINDQSMGSTPLEKNFPEGEVTIKLVPQSTAPGLSTYQTRLSLVNKVVSIVRRKFVSPDSLSDGENISFQPDSAGGTGLSIVTSDPDSASITIDGRPQGLTPIFLSDISPTEHQVVFASPGYQTKAVSVKTMTGYKLMLNVKMAKTGVFPTPTTIPVTSASPATPSATPKIAKPYVRINSTPTGFLRLRASPDSNSAQTGQLSPGNTYPLLKKVTGWYQISVNLTATSSGWVSSQYTSLFE